MRIIIIFKFNHEEKPIASTGVEGDVACILTPNVGDLIQHEDAAGVPFEGKVTERIFKYDLPVGEAVSGTLSVTLCLDSTVVH